jgi:archaellin
MAFMAAASGFAFTTLSSGMTATEQSQKVIEEGISSVQGIPYLKGSVIATSAHRRSVDNVIFCLDTIQSGEPIDLRTGADRTLILDYMSSETRVADLTWEVDFQGYNDGDEFLEKRELAEITVPISPTNGILLRENTDFSIDIKPEKGGVLRIERTTPINLDAVNDLG